MPTLTEGRYDGSALISEANGTQSREVVTLAAGQKVSANQLLGRITASGKYVAHNAAANDGSQNAIAISWANVDASATGTNADTPIAVIARDAEVNADDLVYQAGADAAAKTAANTSLAGRGILVRQAV